jgi:hypothetical protein
LVQSVENSTLSQSVALATSENTATSITHSSIMFSHTHVNVAHHARGVVVEFQVDSCHDICTNKGLSVSIGHEEVFITTQPIATLSQLI